MSGQQTAKAFRYHRRNPCMRQSIDQPIIPLPRSRRVSQSVGSHLVLALLGERRGLCLLVLVKVEGMLDLVPQALPVRRVAVATVLILMDVAFAATL